MLKGALSSAEKVNPKELLLPFSTLQCTVEAMILRTGVSLSDFAFFSSSSNLVMILLQNQSVNEGWGKLWEFFTAAQT